MCQLPERALKPIHKIVSAIDKDTLIVLQPCVSFAPPHLTIISQLLQGGRTRQSINKIQVLVMFEHAQVVVSVHWLTFVDCDSQGSKQLTDAKVLVEGILWSL
jgi:hypothetical protein